MTATVERKLTHHLQVSAESVPTFKNYQVITTTIIKKINTYTEYCIEPDGQNDPPILGFYNTVISSQVGQLFINIIHYYYSFAPSFIFLKLILVANLLPSF